ncbi:MAG: hypothetical protein Q9209_007529 [Squamulea sp. 1 TL-2023]
MEYPANSDKDFDEKKLQEQLIKFTHRLHQELRPVFGDGVRACIGRGFAEQEMVIHIAMALQKFDVEKVDLNYEIQLTGQLGVKPVNFKIRVRRRAGHTLNFGITGGGTYEEEKARQTQHQMQKPQQLGINTTNEVKKPVSVLTSGNMGTSESLVQAFERSAPTFGLDLVDTEDLNTAIKNRTLPTDRSTVIIIPSYEGRLPDNAKKFAAWIEQLASKGDKLPPETKYTVFGVGNNDWTYTVHNVPKLVDQKLEKLGAERIVDAGFANVKRDLIRPWEA